MPSKFYNAITEHDCNQLKLAPFVNPLTKRKTTSIEKVYSMFYACHKKFGHAIPEVILRARKNAKDGARKDDWEQGKLHENMKYAYAIKWGERWSANGVGAGAKISRADALRENKDFEDAERQRAWNDSTGYNARPPPRQAPPPPPQSQRASLNMSQDGESPAKRLQYCKKLSAIAVSEKDNTKFIELGMALARRYGYATGDGKGRIHLRKAMQLVCHPDKYVSTLTPSKHDKVTEYIQIINNRLDRLK